MKIAILSAALLALPVLAQEPIVVKAAQDSGATAEQADAMFYKAFYLERGDRRTAEAVALYKKFLDAAPTSAYAGKAAQYTVNILARSGKPEDLDAFKTKYASVLKAHDISGPEQAPEGRGPGGGARGEMGGPANRVNVDELRKQLEKARADGNAEEVKKLEEQIKQADERATRRGQGGQGGQGGQRGMRGGALRGQKPITEMSDEELGQVEQGLQFMNRMVENMRTNGQGDQADKAAAAVKKLQDALTAGKKEDAEAARQELIKLLPQGRRGGGGGL